MEFVDIRYPFVSFFEFISGGYFFTLEGLHLTISVFFYFGFSLYILKKLPAIQALLIIYFGGAIYSNAAFRVFGLSFSEVVGIINSIIFLFVIVGRPIHKSKTINLLLIIFCIAFIHALFVWCFCPELIDLPEIMFFRLVLIAKIFVVACNIGLFSTFVRDRGSIQIFLNNVISFLAFSAVIYLIQVFEYHIFSIKPMGTFPNAGFSRGVSFGSVATERGHYAKFLVPAIPLILYTLYCFPSKISDKIKRGLYFIACVINFSASGIAFLCAYIFSFITVLGPKITKKQLYLCLTLVVLIIPFFMFFWLEQYIAIVNKIVEYGFEKKSGGRHFSIIGNYLDVYPLGISYGGSSLRTIELIGPVELGLIAFVTQFSFASFLIIFLFVIYFFNVGLFKRKLNIGDNILFCGIIVSLFIFVTDILWFLPIIWCQYQMYENRELYRK